VDILTLFNNIENKIREYFCILYYVIDFKVVSICQCWDIEYHPFQLNLRMLWHLRWMNWFFLFCSLGVWLSEGKGFTSEQRKMVMYGQDSRSIAIRVIEAHNSSTMKRYMSVLVSLLSLHNVRACFINVLCQDLCFILI